MQKEVLDQIYQSFDVHGEATDIVPYGSGHINQTFLVKTEFSSDGAYVLQKINHHVFNNIDKLMDNIQRVSTHLAQKQAEAFSPKKTVKLILTKNCQTYFKDGSGQSWRLYECVPFSHTVDLVVNSEQAFEGGCAFGSFIKNLADFSKPDLHETIVDFHFYYRHTAKLKKQLELDPLSRIKNAKSLIDKVFQYESVLQPVISLLTSGRLPKRVTHNDAKFNNVLLDELDTAICLIDLDTVMPGYIAYDFGDGARSICNLADEDETDLSFVHFDMDRYQSFKSGFLEKLSPILTSDELDSLPNSPMVFALMLCTRFLSDYLEGDRYFKIAYPEHNLHRALGQMALLDSMMAQKDQFSI